MNLFRSEEHARNWAFFNPDLEKNLKPLSFWNDVFSGPVFRSRLRLDYISWLRSDEGKKAREEMKAKLP